MTTSQQLKRFRLRFSIRTLAILVTLICMYAACWGPTKSRGIPQVQRDRGAFRPVAIAPLIVASDGWIKREGDYLLVRRRYHFWFFGYIAKLPWEREVRKVAR